ncbi:hypothetical protein [uncultured Bradyrhizobium sp.]|uniref:hypothetical protein n=1 Tax=uncultured Bradyrhizobium sp. TaxID=199684 RepID=UPI0035CA1A24
MNVDGEWSQVKRELQTKLDRLFSIAPEYFTEFDSLLDVNELAELGYPRNFPHLTCLMCSIPPEHHQGFSDGKHTLAETTFGGRLQFGLLPAACYKVYLQRRDTKLNRPCVVGCEARCYRFEDKPLDSFRAHNFTMKEFVYLGESTGATDHINTGRDIISGFLDRLGITHSMEVANDPFFDSTSSVATLSRALPTKTEVVFEGHAISSLNIHRAYFGNKFNISLDGKPICTSCVAFGVDRWLSMLRSVFSEPRKALNALASARDVSADP